MKNIYFIIISIFCIIYVVATVRKKRFSIKESFWWMLGSISMLILSIFPYSIDGLAKLIGIEYPPSLLFILCIIFLVLMNFRNSKKIAQQQEKIIELAQNLSIIKDEKNEKK